MIAFLIFLAIVIILVYLSRKPKEDYHSNWSLLLPDFKFSTKEFYELVIKEMESHEIEGISFNEESIRIGSIFSEERQYLRVKWGDFHQDICFAPFGDGCFTSWWMIYETTLGEIIIRNMPIVGESLHNAFYRNTYYKVDSGSMFMTYAQKSILAVIDDITKSSGIRISQDERKPIMKSLYLR